MGVVRTVFLGLGEIALYITVKCVYEGKLLEGECGEAI